MLVVVTHPLAFHAVELLKKKKYQLRIHREQRFLSQKELMQTVKGAHALLCLLTDRITADVMDSAGPNLKLIANYAVGYDNIDLVAAGKRGIVVTNTPCDEVSQAVAEHTVTLMLALSRRIVDADQFSKKGKYHGWDANLFLGSAVEKKTLGLIGLGRIGRRVAEIASASLGMSILYYDVTRDKEFEQTSKASYASRERVFKKADSISLHTPLLPQTRHLICKETLLLMKPGALLVNTARGGIVKTADVIQALKSGRLGGFASDVFECEPAIACSKQECKELARLSNVILTPHIGSATLQARTAMARLAVENINAVLGGKTGTCVVKTPV